jgi:hypothetical protein
VQIPRFNRLSAHLDHVAARCLISRFDGLSTHINGFSARIDWLGARVRMHYCSPRFDNLSAPISRLSAHFGRDVLTGDRFC